MIDYRWTSVDNLTPIDAWHYKDKFGVRFYDPQLDGWDYVDMNFADYQHSFETFGLLPAKKPVISPAKPKLNIIDLEGSSTSIDFSESLTGRVEYARRQGTFRYVTYSHRKYWDEILKDVSNALNGKLKWVILDETPGWFYEGRLMVGNPEYKKDRMYLTITGDFEPYKRRTNGTLDDWLWDPFDLVSGVIYNESLYERIPVAAGSTQTIDLICGKISSTFRIRVYGIVDDLTVTLKHSIEDVGITKTLVSTQKTLKNGFTEFAFYDFVSKEGLNKFVFTSPTKLTTISIDYRELSL